MAEDTTILIANPLRYYSSADADAYFAWLESIPCVQSFKGYNQDLEIVILNSKFDEENLRELSGLFRRYNHRIEELKVLETSENQTWFEDVAECSFTKVYPAKKSDQNED